MSNPNIKERIKDAVDFKELVEEYTDLEHKGDEWVGSCPFPGHDDPGPSFHVNEQLGTFYCFGCTRGGDVIRFVQIVEEMDEDEFWPALEMLGNRTDIDVSKSRTSDEHQSHYRIMRAALSFFRDRFESSEAEQYMQDERGFDDETLDNFQIGYNPGGTGAELVEYLREQDIDLSIAEDLYLIQESDSGDGYYDFYRNRVIFPIESVSGRLVGFGGRVMPGGGEPKYLNTGDTPIYTKGKYLYGLRQARSDIRKVSKVIVTEGYTDVMACHQYDSPYVVACLGTALTNQQVNKLKRYVDEIVLLYDGDEMGRKAVRDGGEVCLEEGVQVSGSILPLDKDPADILNNEGFEGLNERVKDRKDYIELMLDWTCEQYSPDEIEGKEKIAAEMAERIAKKDSSIAREDNARLVAERLGIREETMHDKITAHRSEDGGGDSEIRQETGFTLEETLFKTLLQNTEHAHEVVGALEPDDFTDSRHQRLFESLDKYLDDAEELVPKQWLDAIPEDLEPYFAEVASWQPRYDFLQNVDPADVASSIKERAKKSRTRSLLEEGTESDEAGALLKEVLDQERSDDE